VHRQVYDDEPWIRALERWTAGAHAAGAKLVGISFGHQMIVQALGGRVQRNPNGSSVSKMPTELTAAARRYFGTSRSSFDLLYHHHVRTPPRAVSCCCVPLCLWPLRPSPTALCVPHVYAWWR
jgi:GMP synthase-like glutamine amidotransferase